MKHVWLVQSRDIEETDIIFIFSSKKKAENFIDRNEEYRLLGKKIIN